MYEKIIQSLSQLEAVEEIVFSTTEGMVLGHSGRGDPEERAAFTIFVAQMAAKVGDALKWGNFEKGTYNELGEKVLIYGEGEHRIGVFVKPQTSLSLLEDQVEAKLRIRGER